METEKEYYTDEFLKIKTKEELAQALGISSKILNYYLYILSPEKKYTSFEIRKRNGKSRQICAPASGLKTIQKKLANTLEKYYPGKSCVHGYLKGRDIKTNAGIHSSKRILINLDLKDFFPSINFGRVRGLFKASPFYFTDEIATVLAQICCHNGVLPQGAPSSPIVSNFICYRLDNRLLKLCATNKVYYTRYADDLTFSTNLKQMPEEIATIEGNSLTLSSQLLQIIQENGFTINGSKTRFARKNNRQEVTGLIVNSGINVNRKFVREVRAMLHAWEKFGLACAAKEHFTIYRPLSEKEDIELKFKNMLIGKIGYIGHIKGKDHPIYRKLAQRIKLLIPEINIFSFASVLNSKVPTVFCEGKTDSMHLQAALHWFRQNKEFEDLQINFFNPENKHHINNTQLLKACETLEWSKLNNNVVICLFDRDVPSINKEAEDPIKRYKAWGNNVFSFLLPIPPHRNFNEICIEHYYTDQALMTQDENKRRIFLSTEFNVENGHHKTENLIYGDKNKLKAKFPRIISDNVIDIETGNKVALSKNDFAQNILQKKGAFGKFTFENFRPLFDLFSAIIKEANIK